MQSWIDEYLTEVEPNVEMQDFVRNYSVTENIWVDNKHIGIFVYTTNLDIITIHVLWIKQQYRHTFRQASKYILEFAKQKGYRKIELVSDLRVCQLVERYLKLKPVQKIYLEEVDKILEVL